MYFPGRKAQLPGCGFFAIQFFQNFDRYGDRIVLKLVEALRIVQENIGIKDKDFGLGRMR